MKLRHDLASTQPLSTTLIGSARLTDIRDNVSQSLRTLVRRSLNPTKSGRKETKEDDSELDEFIVNE